MYKNFQCRNVQEMQRSIVKQTPRSQIMWNVALKLTTELYNNWRTCSYASFSQRSVAKNMADFE